MSHGTSGGVPAVSGLRPRPVAASSRLAPGARPRRVGGQWHPTAGPRPPDPSIGHSTRPLEELVEMLRAFEVTVADALTARGAQVEHIGSTKGRLRIA